MFNMKFPKMSSKMLEMVKGNLSTGAPMEMNAPAAGAMNVVNMTKMKPPEPPQSTMQTDKASLLGAVKKSKGLVGGF
jgi:hypothetical protein